MGTTARQDTGTSHHGHYKGTTGTMPRHHGTEDSKMLGHQELQEVCEPEDVLERRSRLRHAGIPANGLDLLW
ncbi:unnamed protein product [Effrenium voratum]|nr:unnamed protein product [Effrenium voratum]